MGWDMGKLNIMVDMAGCPNRCRHCWLGSHKNGQMSIDDFRIIAKQFKGWRNEQGLGINDLGFFSWWREPDFRDDYRELWEMEQELSMQGHAQRYELLSVWRLARDESYAKWASTLEPKVCQITFFGMEEATDWGTNRKDAFKDCIVATNRLIEVGIAPRWQLFITKRGLSDLDSFLRLIYDLKLHKRCEEIGRKFEVFIGGASPEGNGYGLEDERIEEKDLHLIPQGLVDICREGVQLLGQPEYVLLNSLLAEDMPPNATAPPAIAINANWDAYPNIAEPTEWWRLGNLKADGVDSVIRAYRDETTLGMMMNRNTPVSELAQKYGIRDSSKLYDKSDLVSRFMHQWGIDLTR
jgi:hypothetical protein